MAYISFQSYLIALIMTPVSSALQLPMLSNLSNVLADISPDYLALIGILLFTCLTNLPISKAERNLSSPVVTNWGVWGEFVFCPNGTFVTGMQLKTESSQGWFSDDTSLNGVQFFCSTLEESRSESEKLPIKSLEDSWGSWGRKYWCNGLATGFQLRSEKNQGALGDDTAANNLRLACNGNVPSREGDGTSFGDWTEPQFCSRKEAFCGISTQVYTDHGSGDETAMDGLRVKCCDVPDPAIICVPTDNWDLIIECDNLEAVSPTTCSYVRKLGTTNSSSSSENHWELVQTYSEIGFSIFGALSSLPINFGMRLGQNSSTGFDWTQTNSEVWHEEVTTTVTFEVPPRIKSQLFQISGSCGIYNAKATRFRKVDYDALTQVQTVSYFDVTNN